MSNISIYSSLSFISLLISLLSLKITPPPFLKTNHSKFYYSNNLNSDSNLFLLNKLALAEELFKKLFSMSFFIYPIPSKFLKKELLWIQSSVTYS